MSVVRLPNDWDPRPYQMPAFTALERGRKRLLLIWHRRAGKDDICLHTAACQAMRRVGNYWHMLPQYAQARKAIWDAINPHTGIRRINEAFPMAIRKSTNQQEMKIEFRNGSIWQLVGSDTYNALVGSPPIGVTASEWALANPEAWGYLRPILRENGGWAAFISTPRGRNHLHRMYEGSKNDPQWHVERLTAADTGVFSAEDLAAERRELIREHGEDDGEALYQQEYFVSFDAAIVGAYYSRQMVQAEKEKRITRVPADPSMPVHTAWDLGMSDMTCIWFFQRIGVGEIRVVDYLQHSGVGLDWYARELRNRPYVYGEHILPHDVDVSELGTGTTRKSSLESLGISPIIVAPKSPVADGINAVRMLFPRCWFDADKCATGLDGLAQYRREWDDERKVYHDRPVHDFASHPADAFRYLAVAMNRISMGALTRPSWEDDYGAGGRGFMAA